MISMLTHLQVMQPDLTFGLLALGFFKLGQSFPDISLLVPLCICDGYWKGYVDLGVVGHTKAGKLVETSDGNDIREFEI